jgi:AraC-like DNA-binding protein
LNAKLSFDLERDFEPITMLVKNPLLFAVNAKVPARTLGEFVALAKAEPGRLNYGTSGASTQAHLLLEMWSARAGIRMQHIPYRGGAPAALAVAAGEVQLVLLSPLGILPQIEAGLVRALATGGLARDPKFPDLPTAAESGFPGFEAVHWLGLLTTAGTPKDIVARLNAEVNRALREPDVATKLALQGTTPAGGSADEFKTLIATEIRNWKEVAQRANTLAQIAANHRLSTRYVQHLFELSGTSFTRFVLEQRLLLAHRLLREPKSRWRKISEVCAAAGFSDISYFNRAFRARFGARPTDVRASFEHERRDPVLPPSGADEPASG